MRVLLFRALTPAQLASLVERHPQSEFIQTTDATVAAAELTRCEVAFGPVPPDVAARSPSLRWVQLISAGLDGYEPLGQRKLLVTTAHGVHTAALAEHLVMGILAGVRRLPYFLERQQARTWDRQVGRPALLQGQHVGLIGYGAVGHEVARRLRAFGVRLSAVKREAAACPPELDNLGTIAELDALLSIADHIVLSLPLTRETRGLIDRGRIARMKPGAWFHTIARGGLVDEAALRQRLQEGSLSGATMDVFDAEPLPPDSPWWTTPNTFVTPHLAGHHAGLPAATFARFCENFDRYVRGEPLSHLADFKRGY